MSRPEKIRLGDLLVNEKLLSVEQLNLALEQQKRTGRKLGRVLVDNSFVSEDQISEALAKQLSIPFVNLKYYSVNLDTVRRLPENQARRYRAIVLEELNGVLLVGMTDPTDLFAFDEVSRFLQRDIDLAVVTEGQLLEVIDRAYRRTEEISGLARELPEDAGATVVDFAVLTDTVGLDDAPVVKLLHSMFDEASRMGASDIHIEPQEGTLKIRFRIDGALHLHTEAGSKMADALLLRLKQMAGLDVAQKRLPQDGRFNILVREQAVGVHISTLPTQYGESVVMQLPRQSGGLLTLDKLGMPPAMLKRFRELLWRSHAMVLVTGPSGSGKTSTLYAALAEINSQNQKIITVEDPVEYSLPGISQVQVNEKIDLTFARVLRSVLRQDPDVILVGEMHDGETAQIGMRAAMSGHLVLSTLCTRDTADTLFRLVDMGVPKYMVASSVQVVLAQRLIRRVCENCAEPYTPTPQEVEWLEHAGLPRQQWGTLLRGCGCPQCNGSGYRGRMGIFEMLEMTQPLVDAAAHRDSNHFMRAARSHLEGRTLVQQALEQMQLGRTSVAEVMCLGDPEQD
jgi:MSHA biogenesis protein MshE